MNDDAPIAIRWTIGDVSRRGFEALRLSIWGAWRLFGPSASYVVCVNTIPLPSAQLLTGEIPDSVTWHASTPNQLPEFVRPHLDDSMVEGVGWKFAPLRLFPEHHELALDNDCILWEMPTAIRHWLARAHDETCVIAQDVRPAFGQFARFCRSTPCNSGIRGLPPRFDFAHRLRSLLEAHPVRLTSELDEQGLQVAAVSRSREPLMVGVDEVSICSPFPPHQPHLGTCGAHFVGLNARKLPWALGGRPAHELIREHWEKHRDTLYQRVGISPLAEA